ncbi:MAG TPA: hypothetical protein VLD37_06880 [Candidatus Bilamarchaeum sp.]|nr:hypothetical protein [Candidatus Bilamarchaeum sp.]
MLLFRKNDAYAKFHAMQSILLTVALVVLSVLIGIGARVLDALPFLGWIAGLVLFALAALLNLAVFLLWLYLMWKAYAGEKWMLPLIGAEADKMARKA